MAKKKSDRRANEVTLSDQQKYLQAQWIYHKRNSNAVGLDTTDVGAYIEGIIKFTGEFMLDTTIPDDLREWAAQLNAGAKAVSGNMGGKHQEAVKAGFVLGMIWEQFKFHAGPLAEAVKEHSGIVSGNQASAKKRQNDREKVIGAARKYLAKGRTDVLGLLEAGFPKYAKRTLQGILREVKGRKSR
jgi:hypothetical protein